VFSIHEPGDSICVLYDCGTYEFEISILCCVAVTSKIRLGWNWSGNSCVTMIRVPSALAGSTSASDDDWDDDGIEDVTIQSPLS